MRKKVKITINSTPITNISTGVIMVRGTYSPMELDEDDIFRCICGKAIVEELLDNGKFLPLTLSNYNKDNNNNVNGDGEKPIGIPPIKYDSHAQPELIKPDLSQNNKNLVNPVTSLEEVSDQDVEAEAEQVPETVDRTVNDEMSDVDKVEQGQSRTNHNNKKGNSYKK